MIFSYNLKIKSYSYHYNHSVCLFSSTAYSIIVTVLNELLLLDNQYPRREYLEELNKI